MSEENLKEVDCKLAETELTDERIGPADSFLKLHRLTVRLPNGATSKRDVVKHPGACAMIAMDEKGYILLERQWRAPFGRAFWEIPAGKIDPNEPSLTCAKRELEEEAGIRAAQWTFLGTMHNAIGYSNEHIDVYLAEKLTEGKRHLDDNEFLFVEKRHWKEVLAMTYTGEITDAKTICAMHWFLQYLKESGKDSS